MTELYLEHHGVKGQKWGVTRTPEQLGHKKKKKINPVDVLNKTVEGVQIKLSSPKKKMTDSEKSVHSEMIKAYNKASRMGLKQKNGKYNYASNKDDPNLRRRQQRMAKKVEDMKKEYFATFGKEPISQARLESARVGAIVGTVLGGALPLVGAPTSTIAGYLIGDRIGSLKHSDEELNYV